jgi:hypothetical protein
MKTLDEIMIEVESDKASQFTRTYARPHGYTVHLERFFDPIRNDPIKLLEVGTGGGESMRGWLEFFPNARVYGIDIVSNTNPYNTPGTDIHERYTFSCGDQSKPEFWKKFVEVYGGDFDVVIDDGSHQSDDIMTTISCMWPHIKSGGIYEIEDLNSAPEAAKHIQAWANGIISGTSTADSIYFARELCVMRKK